MIEVRFHGRGGQGAVTSAEMLALAAIIEGKYAQAFPSFGPERRGAPVQAFVRTDDKPVRVRADIKEPDVVVVLDPGLLDIVNVTDGLKEHGAIIVNTRKSPEDVKAKYGNRWKVATVDASTIARETIGVPIVNTTMLGAIVKVTNLVSISSLEEPLNERFGDRASRNFKACQTAFERTQIA